MQLHDIGEWIKLRYKNGSVGYVQSLPEDKKDLLSLHYLVDGKLHNENGPAEVYFIDHGYNVRYYFYLNGKCLDVRDWEKAIADS